MPKLEGYELAAVIATRSPTLRVIFISGYISSPTRQSLEEVGAGSSRSRLRSRTSWPRFARFSTAPDPVPRSGLGSYARGWVVPTGGWREVADTALAFVRRFV